MSRFSHSVLRRSAAVVGLLLLTSPLTSAVVSPVHAADSLATPITGTMAKELWPIEVTVEVRALEPLEGLAAPLPPRTVTVPDGHRLRFSSTVQTRTGKRRFELALVPRHHPETIEVEWDLEVHEARLQPIGWRRYLEHRFNLEGELPLGEERLKIARADIVSTQDDEIRIRFDIDDEPFEIRLLALTTRG